MSFERWNGELEYREDLNQLISDYENKMYRLNKSYIRTIRNSFLLVACAAICYLGYKRYKIVKR